MLQRKLQHAMLLCSIAIAIYHLSDNSQKYFSPILRERERENQASEKGSSLANRGDFYLKNRYH